MNIVAINKNFDAEPFINFQENRNFELIINIPVSKLIGLPCGSMNGTM